MDNRLLSLLFPKARCLACDEPRELDPGAALCDQCAKALDKLRLQYGICPHCLSPIKAQQACRYCAQGGMHRISAAYAPYRYHGVSQRLISRLKFPGIGDAALPLKEGMLDCLSGASFDLMVPVPMHNTDVRKRGYNQSELLCRLLSQESGIPFLNALSKVQKTKKQSSLSHQQREENIRYAFMTLRPITGLRVLLVDDVRTTGSTARACAHELLKAGAMEVSLLTATVAASYESSSDSSSPLALW